MEHTELLRQLEFEWHGYNAKVRSDAEGHGMEPEYMTWAEFLQGRGVDPQGLEEDNDVDVY